MSLPKIAIPMFEIMLPSTGKMINMRSMTTKDYKLLLVAKESNNNEQMLIAVKQVLNNCICDSKIKTDNLSWYDAEWLFVKLIVSSKADPLVNLSYKCKLNKEDGEKCNTNNKFSVNIDDIKINVTKSELLLKAKDESGEDIIMKFVYPSFTDMEIFKKLSNKLEQMDFFNELLVAVSVGDELYIKGKDFGPQEAGVMIDALSEEQMKEILAFMEEMPALKLDHQFTCTGCGFNHTVILKGMKDFF